MMEWCSVVVWAKDNTFFSREKCCKIYSTGLKQLKPADVELGAMFFLVTVQGFVWAVKQSRCRSRHVAGVSLHDQTRGVCHCFVNRDYERAAGRLFSGGAGSSAAICITHPEHTHLANSVTFPLPPALPSCLLLPFVVNNQHLAQTVLHSWSHPSQKRENENGETFQTDTQEVSTTVLPAQRLREDEWTYLPTDSYEFQFNPDWSYNFDWIHFVGFQDVSDDV